MLSKESKIRVLENFYALDYVFFGKNVGRVENCCPLVKEEYLSIKGALLSVFVEMLKLVNHTPEIIDEKVNSEVLLQGARASAKTARKNAQRIVSTNKSRANIKESLKKMIKEDKDLDISAVIESQIRQKAFSLAVDNLLLARVVSESKDFDQLNDWEGTIIEDSYKILRDNLIESAYELLYEEDEEDEEDEKEEDLEEGRFGDVAGAFKKEKEIKKSDMTPAQKKVAWAKHIVSMCKKDAVKHKWSPEKFKNCIAKAKKSS